MKKMIAIAAVLFAWTLAQGQTADVRGKSPSAPKGQVLINATCTAGDDAGDCRLNTTSTPASGSIFRVAVVDGGTWPSQTVPRRWSQTCAATVAGPIATDGGTAVLSVNKPEAAARRTWSSGYACCNCTEGTGGALPAAITSCSGTASIAPGGSRIVPGVDYGWLPPAGVTTTPDAGPSDAQVCLCACETGTCAITSCPPAE